MMRRLFDSLPGPMAVKVLVAVAVVVVALILLGFVFDAAGDFLDDGGTIGA